MNNHGSIIIIIIFILRGKSEFLMREITQFFSSDMSMPHLVVTIFSFYNDLCVYALQFVAQSAYLFIILILEHCCISYYNKEF